MSVLAGLSVRRTTAAQQLADGLADRIMSGAFSPGQPLRESAIAAELGVARNTVREAVRILALSGLVRHEVNRGAVVLAPTPATVDDLYTARLRLESAAASHVITGPALAAVRARFADLTEAAGTHDARRIVTTDLAFHAAVVAGMASRRIDAFYADLTQEPNKVVAEHQRIMRAVESGDRERAVAEVTAHVETNAARVRQIILARGWSDADAATRR